MELVYPIYIDTPMMTSFLASLEGGLIDETSLEEKTSSSKEKGRSGAGGAKVGGLLSGLLSLEANAEVSQKLSDSLEANYRSTVKFPEASLFIRLRELLRHEGLIQDFSSIPFDELKMGALIEFGGFVSPNPAFQLRHFAQQISPLMEPIAAMGEK